MQLESREEVQEYQQLLTQEHAVSLSMDNNNGLRGLPKYLFVQFPFNINWTLESMGFSRIGPLCPPLGA